MKKVTITKNQNLVAEAEFPTQELAQAWLQSEISNRSFGKPERWVSEDRIQLEGENIDNSVEMIIEPILGRDVKLYKFSAEFSFAITDVSSAVAEKEKMIKRSKKRAFGEKLIDKISVLNEGKSLSSAQIDSVMTNSTLALLREHLWAGNIPTFLSKLQESDVSAFFTAQEKSALMTECQTFLTSIGE